MIQLVNVTKSFGGRTLFEEVTFSLGSGEIIGLVGRNGTGKSTLFKIITGVEPYDSGDVKIPKSYKIGTLDQHIHFTHKSVVDECMSALGPEFKYETYRAEKLLTGLGFSDEDFEKDPQSFSGGYQIRINLVKTLLTEPNCLLLDEPTNYLDIVSLQWLRSFLKSFNGEVILITHDRSFMDSVTTHTMGVHRGKLRKIKGQTKKYYEQLEQDEIVYEQTRINQEKKIKHMMDYVDKYRVSARGASQAQSRLKAIEKMQDMQQLDKIADLDFSFNHTPCPGKQIMKVKNLSFGYTEENLFSGVTFEVDREDRIGIIGKNGKGKSTLLNVLSHELKERTGEIWEHPSLALGHFGQTNVQRLHPENSITQEIQEVNTDLNITRVKAIAGTMLFTGEDSDKKISVLSGGEKARVMLGKILAQKTNLLFLDEPTNHLDMESIDSLGEAINEYDGACLIVTHNEDLLRSCVNKLVIFRQDGAEFFEGTYDEFLEKIGWEETPQTKKEKKAVEKEKKPEKTQETSSGNKYREEEVMAQIETLEKYQSVLEEKIQNASAAGDTDAITSAGHELELVNAKIDELLELL
ncbi:ABC transporter, ATP-binding protein [Halobacteriovorax sp. BALOs_7]|uniref:ABC transporter ATP-binding protein n=1 Tax=Halobacteriovorax vibrionivorans TaxID=2152716 RepID=A0ABY0IMG0_9BACT|nr:MULTISPECIES: ABC-F family ATP-binding cassette domain-containing protein [Halobacteriovorax]AYF45641.1 ABC transporter, ATP-binding protein [Halobacteriovorax sp. BALOs_7]RZF22704.1 ABC transporter ATP-binding protein [Halobacteriovorax vibrionivorans]TGD46725.1 ABC transporter ATP-binding protein [Halobacteriovorax sp. Y22]